MASLTRPLQIAAALALGAAAVVVGYWLHGDARFGRDASLTWWVGIALGLVLQRARFCFFCNLREAIEEREPRPLLGILVALAAGTVGAVVIFGAWIPEATAGYLPQRGHISPAAWPMLAGGLVFGVGMAFSGSCISAHFYRLAEGSPLSPVALATALGGFALGDLLWNPLYLAAYRTAKPLWLPGVAGFGAALLGQLAVLGLLGGWLWRRRTRKTPEPEAPAGVHEALWVRRWPWWAGGLAVGAIATVALLRTQPLGVTAELTARGHQLAQKIGFAPERLEGIDGLRGCILPASSAPLSLNALLILGLVAGAFFASLLGGHWEWERPPIRRVASAAVGGLLLGVGARMALGCTIGTLLGGVTALSLSGWLFGAGLVGGVWAGLRLRRAWW